MHVLRLIQTWNYSSANCTQVKQTVMYLYGSKRSDSRWMFINGNIISRSWFRRFVTMSNPHVTLAHSACSIVSLRIFNPTVQIYNNEFVKQNLCQDESCVWGYPGTLHSTYLVWPITFLMYDALSQSCSNDMPKCNPLHTNTVFAMVTTLSCHVHNMSARVDI